MRFKPANGWRENQSKDNETCLEYVPKMVKICSGKIQWPLLNLLLLKNKLNILSLKKSWAQNVQTGYHVDLLHRWQVVVRI